MQDGMKVPLLLDLQEATSQQSCLLYEDFLLLNCRLVVRKAKKEKKMKDPHKPKRPPSAFLFSWFRKQYKEKYGNNKSVVVVGKAGGYMWKSMSDEVGDADDEYDNSKSEVIGDEDYESGGDVDWD
ncbi:unnamed protein product [Fraxinus pennsylvanica]|uniref:HMG box domain-containing protein n=1 Tax=Fraxinus pennsylvanica TaxID=56036 RepID=A0AAD2E8P7_9LAMI|nr:unnamed protein product [Fraxinus pennsylvanica]